MNNLAKAEARKIIKYYGITSPNEINIISIAAGLNAYVDEKTLMGCEGRVLYTDKVGIIVVNSQIRYESKKRFVIAHELGHFMLHRNLSLFNCDEKTFFDWHQTGSQESEANSFAAELLLPESLFLEQSRGKIISVDLIENLSTNFRTSFLSTAFRYTEIGQHPTAIVYCEDGIIKWSSINKDFSYRFIRPNQEISTSSYAFDFFNKNYNDRTIEKVPSEAWFWEDYDFDFEKDKFIYEQLFTYPSHNGVLVFLWED